MLGERVVIGGLVIVKGVSSRGVSRRGELRTGITVALMVEWRRFLEATGNLVGRFLGGAGLVTVSREEDVTIGTGWGKMPALVDRE